MNIEGPNRQRHSLTVTIGEEGLLSISSPQSAIVSDAHLLLPRLAPAFLNCADPSDDEAIGAPPRLEDGRLDEEDADSGRRCFRLTGILRHPARPEHRLYYEARVSLGSAPLIEVEYARVRSLDGRITLTHWEHHLLLDSCDSVLFGALDEPRQVAVFDLVLGPGSGAEALAVRDQGLWLVLASSDLRRYREGAFSLRSDPERPGVHHFGMHRISPDWAYSGAIHQSLESIDLPEGGALSASFTLEVQTDPPHRDALHPVEGGRSNETPGSPEAEILYLHRPPPRETADNNTRLADRIREKIEFFTITFRAGNFSANSDTFSICAELGMRHCSVSSPGRDVPEIAAVWKHSPVWPTEREGFIDVPLTTMPSEIRPNGFPLELRIERTGDSPDDMPLRVLRSRLAEIASWPPESPRVLVALTHTSVPYHLRPARELAVIDRVVEESRRWAVHNGYRLALSSVGDVVRGSNDKYEEK